MTLNMSKAKFTVLKKGRFLAANEVWRYGDEEIEDVNSYKSLELNFSTRLFELLLLEGGGEGGGILYWTVPPCGIFCIELCVILCHLVAYFIFNSVLHCATLRDILYWTVCYTVPPCGTFCIGMCVTLCHRVGHFVWDCVLHCAWRSWIHVRNDILKLFANIFSVKVNMSKSKIIVFRKGRFFAASTSLGGMVMRWRLEIVISPSSCILPPNYL